LRADCAVGAETPLPPSFKINCVRKMFWRRVVVVVVAVVAFLSRNVPVDVDGCCGFVCARGPLPQQGGRKRERGGGRKRKRKRKRKSARVAEGGRARACARANK
jgi:hypothetical protein